MDNMIKEQQKLLRLQRLKKLQKHDTSSMPRDLTFGKKGVKTNLVNEEDYVEVEQKMQSLKHIDKKNPYYSALLKK